VRVSYVIVHGGDAPDRVRNLEFLLRYVAPYPFEVIVVEQGPTPRLTLDRPGIRHVFGYNLGLFNRAWALNVGAQVATGDVLICSDHDILIPREILLGIPRVDRLIVPYRTCLDLSAEETRILHDGGSLAGLTGSPREGTSAGGAFVIDRAAYLEIGGMCEDFEGWGAEDDAFYDKCGKTIGVLRSTSVVWHMYHDRPTLDDAAYARNAALLQWERMKSAAILRASAPRDIGDPNKYIKRAIGRSMQRARTTPRP